MFNYSQLLLLCLYFIDNRRSSGNRAKTTCTSSTSSGSTSCLSTKEIERRIDTLKDQRHRELTHKNYYAIWKLFNKFFLQLDRKLKTWEKRLTLFVGYRIEDHKCSSMVKSYISATRAVLRNVGIKLNTDHFLLDALTKACKLKNDVVKTRLPIQKGLLTILVNHVRQKYLDLGQDYLAALYPALLSTAYYGLLRVGEVTTG